MRQETLIVMPPNPRFATDERGTPEWFFKEVQHRIAFGSRFNLDVCASNWNHKIIPFIDAATDAFATPWLGESVWCNPPYSQVAPWLERGLDELHIQHNANQLVYLLPNRSSALWWHRFKHHFRREEIPFRINFDYPPGEAQKDAAYEHSTLWIAEAEMSKP